MSSVNFSAQQVSNMVEPTENVVFFSIIIELVLFVGIIFYVSDFWRVFPLSLFVRAPILSEISDGGARGQLKCECASA